MTTVDADLGEALADAVQAAHREHTPLCLRGAGTRDFYGRAPTGTPLAVADHRGVVSYEPTELVLTARAGTPLDELDALLAEQGQRLACEPPRFGPGSTLGGAVASGLSGPRRPYCGALRDFVLGVQLVNGTGTVLRFGGEVMKNVAGYDLSRLMVGALGTLGLLLEVSLKVLPAAAHECTLSLECDAAKALYLANRWAGTPLPLDAIAWYAGRLCVRLAGTTEGVTAARLHLGGEEVPAAESHWLALRDHGHPFLAAPGPLWRLSVPPGAPLPELPGEWMIEWGGAQRWLRTEAPAASVRAATAAIGGHSTLFRGGRREDDVFQPLPAPLHALHRRLKMTFDPQGILNPGRLYRDL